MCGAGNMEPVRSLGADKVIDHTREDFPGNGETYDVIFDTVNKSSFFRCRGSLKKDGSHLPTSGLMNNALMLWTSITGGRRAITGMSVEKNEALTFPREPAGADGLKVVIDRRYRLEQGSDRYSCEMALRS